MAKSIEQLKLEEDLRFYIENLILVHGIKRIETIQSFTVKMQNGSVKSVTAK